MKKTFTHNRVRRNFDMPAQFSACEPFIPTKAVNEREIARRRASRAHTTVLRQQTTGIEAGMVILAKTTGTEAEKTARTSVAKALLGASWHQYAEHALGVYRRTLQLPLIAAYEPEDRPSAAYFRDQGIDMLIRASHLAVHLRVAHEMRAPKVFERTAFELGIHMGDIALVLSTTDIADHVA